MSSGKLKKRVRNFVIDSWEEGKYFDLWMIVHFLTGTLFGQGLRMLGAHDLFAFFMTLSVLIVWEIFEIRMSIEERDLNRLLDIIVGMAGFVVFYSVIPGLGSVGEWVKLGVLIALAIGFSVSGWLAYLRRARKIRNILK